MMTPTHLTITALYGPLVPLSEICETYFGMGYTQAKNKAAIHALPVAAFRIHDSQKAPLLLRAEDFAAWIDATAQSAQKEWVKTNT